MKQRAKEILALLGLSLLCCAAFIGCSGSKHYEITTKRGVSYSCPHMTITPACYVMMIPSSISQFKKTSIFSCSGNGICSPDYFDYTSCPQRYEYYATRTKLERSGRHGISACNKAFHLGYLLRRGSQVHTYAYWEALDDSHTRTP